MIFLTSRLKDYNISLDLIEKKTGLKKYKLQKMFNYAKNNTPEYYNRAVAQFFAKTKLQKMKNEITKNAKDL